MIGRDKKPLQRAPYPAHFFTIVDFDERATATILGFRKTQALRLNPTMPTIATFLGCRVVIYPNDHRPAHVHVMGRGCEAVFELNCPEGPPRLRENYGFSRKDITQIQLGLEPLLAQLCTDWEHLHGTQQRRI